MANEFTEGVEAIFARPMEVDGPTAAFGGAMSDIARLMPAYEALPDEFTGGSNPWVDWQRKWFFSGLKALPEPREGIDLKAAMTHLMAIQKSFSPKHEHKEAAVAYLASLWFESPEPKAEVAQ